MKRFVGNSSLGCNLGNERGSGSYSVLGFIIIAVVVVCAIAWFPWDQMMGGGKESGLQAAKQAMQKKEWDKAIGLLDKTIKATPGDGQALIARSVCFLQIGSTDKALADAKSAVAKQPNSGKSIGQLALVHKVLGSNDEAMKNLNLVVKIEPNNAWALAQLADIYSRQKEQDKALDFANRALKAKPNFTEGYRLQAWILSRSGKCREASESFKKVAQLSPKDPQSLQDQAWFLLTCPDEKLQDPNKALALAQEANQLAKSQNGEVLETLAEAYFRKGEYLKAADYQKKAVDLAGKKCPDGSCIKEMSERLKKYELAARHEERQAYEILPMDGNL